jgi:drug/metabolite transporter (DMT)-like permease
LYAVGSLGLQRAMQRGASARRVFAVSTVVLALWGWPIFFFFPGDWGRVTALEPVLAAVLAGAALFAGRFCTLKALEVGDLSVVVPILGMKKLWVALGSAVVGSAAIDARLLGGAFLATLGVALLQRSPPQNTRNNPRSWPAIGLAFAASVLFAVTDVITQEYARALGVGIYQPILLATLVLLLPVMGKTPLAPQAARRPLWVGSVVVGLQTTAVILVIGLTGQATLVNILYSTRAIWSVLVDRLAGGEGARRYLGSRIVGAALLMAAIILALLR